MLLLTSHFSDTLSSSSTTGPSAELETVTLGGSRKYLYQTRLGQWDHFTRFTQYA